MEAIDYISKEELTLSSSRFRPVRPGTEKERYQKERQKKTTPIGKKRRGKSRGNKKMADFLGAWLTPSLLRGEYTEFSKISVK